MIMECVSTIPLSLYIRPPPRNLHSQRPPLQEAKCQAPAAVSPAQDGSLVAFHPYVTGSGKDREYSLADYSNSTKQQHPLTVCLQPARLHCLYPGAENNSLDAPEEEEIKREPRSQTARM